MTRTNLGDVLAARPDAVALIDVREWEHPRSRTHGDIDREANGVAAGLAARGYPRGTAIAIIGENRTEYISAFLGITRAGYTAVPINAKFPAATVAHILADASVALTFCDARSAALLPADAPAIAFDDETAGFAAFTAGATAFDIVAVQPDDVAMILYTSGSTGRPKGVPLTHRAQRWILDNRVAQTRGAAPACVLIVAPLSHMNALGMTLFVLASGGSGALLPRFDVARFIMAAERFRCETLSTVPAMMAMMLREHDLLERTDLSRIRTIRMGSAPIPEKLWDDVQRAFPGATIRNGYGTTEAGPGVFGSDGRTVPRGALGWPQPGFEVRIVDDAGNDAAEGTLWMRSPANARGYLHLPDATQRAFTADGWYISGDRFRRDAEGAYWFVGRDDDMFVCGGENVFPAEVESVIDRCPGVAESAVVPVPDDIKGEKPFAFVVRARDATVGEDEIKRFVLDRAPAYQHPRMVAFLDSLPMSGPGKVDRTALVTLARMLWSERSVLTS